MTSTLILALTIAAGLFVCSFVAIVLLMERSPTIEDDESDLPEFLRDPPAEKCEDSAVSPPAASNKNRSSGRLNEPGLPELGASADERAAERNLVKHAPTSTTAGTLGHIEQGEF